MGEVRLDLEKQVMWIGDREYFFQENSDSDFGSASDSEDELTRLRWYRESKKFVTFDEPRDDDAKKMTIEQAKEIDPEQQEWLPAHDRIKDPEKVKELTRAFTKAEPEAKANRQELKDVKEWLENNRGPRNRNGRALVVERLSSTDSESDRHIFDWEVRTHDYLYLHNANKKLRYGWWRIEEDEPERIGKHLRVNKALRDAVIAHKNEIKRKHSDSEQRSTSSDPVESSLEKETKVPKRTKWGVRIWSNDEKHYFAVGVWKSKKYEGCTTVRLTVAGRTCMYTVDTNQMEALRNEFSRGVPT